MKNTKQKLLSIALSLFSSLILFFCIGLSMIGIPSGIRQLSDESMFFKFLDSWGLSIAFLLTIFSFILIFLYQKMIRNQSKDKRLNGDENFDLEVSELRSQRILHDAPVGVFQSTPSGKLIYANLALALQCGFESVGEFIEFVNSDPRGVKRFYVDTGLRKSILHKLKSEFQPWARFQHQMYRKDGTCYDASMHLSLRYDETLGEECLFGFIEDVTERLEAEKKLANSERRYRELIDKANSIIVKVTAEGRITYLNNFAQEFFGFELSHIIGQHVVGTIAPENMISGSEIESILGKIISAPDHFYQNEGLNKRHDGSLVWIYWSSKAIVEDDGRVNEILCIGTDVTERKRMEESLRCQVTIEKFLQETTNRLINVDIDNIDDVINQSLDQIKHFFQADCAYVCFFNSAGFIDHCYARSNTPDYDYRQFIDEFFMKVSSWWFETLEREAYVLFKTIDDIPGHLEYSAKAARDAGLEQVLVEPIFYRDRFVGFIGINAATKGLDWESKKTGLLRICGGMLLDLLEKKRIQKGILKSRERLDTAVRGAYLGMFDWDISSGEIIFNDIWFRMLGYSPHELPHTYEMWESLLHPDDRDKVLKNVKEYLNGAISFFSCDFRLKAKNGDWKWIHSQGHVTERGEDRQPLRMVGLQRDISELKKTETELCYQRDLFGLLIENMPLGVYAKDVNNQYQNVIWNKKMEQLIGLTKDEVLGKSDHELFDHKLADFYLEDDMLVARDKMVKTVIQDDVETRSGKKCFFTVKVPVLDEQGSVTMVLGIINDITEKHCMEEQLRHNQKMQAIGQLAAGVAHEIKNPLGIILLAAEGLEMTEGVATNKKLNNKISMIKTAAEKADMVVKELLKFSRVSDAEMREVDVHQIIDDAYFLSKNREKEKQINFNKEFVSQPAACYGNSILLGQVFVNLFNNAIDAIDERGGILVRTDLTEDVTGFKKVVIEVRDDGKGIQEKNLSKIFDPFYTTKDEGSGIGLGLSTVFTIIEKHQGNISVASNAKEGTVFTITLPFYEAEVQS